MDDRIDPLDAAIQKRLRRLDSMAVDTTRLDRRLAAEIPRPAAARRLYLDWFRGVSRLWRRWRCWPPLSGAVLLVMTLSSPVEASIAQMAKLHQDLVNKRIPVVQVDSIAAANQALLGQTPQGPSLPAVPQEHVMACCMKSVRNKQMACVLLKGEGTPISMAVAKAEDMDSPHGPTVTRNGNRYYVHTSQQAEHGDDRAPGPLGLPDGRGEQRAPDGLGRHAEV